MNINLSVVLLFHIITRTPARSPISGFFCCEVTEKVAGNCHLWLKKEGDILSPS